MTIQEFASGYDTIKKLKDYKGYEVWEASRTRDRNRKIGYPFFILKMKGAFRQAKPKEAREIMATNRTYNIDDDE